MFTRSTPECFRDGRHTQIVGFHFTVYLYSVWWTAVRGGTVPRTARECLRRAAAERCGSGCDGLASPGCCSRLSCPLPRQESAPAPASRRPLSASESASTHCRWSTSAARQINKVQRRKGASAIWEGDRQVVWGWKFRVRAHQQSPDLWDKELQKLQVVLQWCLPDCVIHVVGDFIQGKTRGSSSNPTNHP